MQNRLVEYLKHNYTIYSFHDFKNAIKEVLQLCILSGLERGGFFKEAIFYGGTSLRILRGLDRFSEDLDFTLRRSNNNFKLEKYITYMLNELESIGIKAICKTKNKNIDTSVITTHIIARLRDLLDMFNYDFNAKENENIDIKIYLETNVFNGYEEEFKITNFPSFSAIRTFKMPTMFASKLLAILGRDWKNRVKGRDYFDYLFYVSSGVEINLDFLNNGLIKFGIKKEKLSFEDIKKMLREKFLSIDFNLAKNDVKPFIKNEKNLEIFDRQLFLSTIDSLKAQN